MKKALILIDVQEDFLTHTMDYIAPLSQNYLSQHGNDYDLIILTRWVHDENEGEDTLLISHHKAHVVEKRQYSAYTPETKKLLEDHGIEEVHIGGVDAEMAVLATMYALLDAGYRVKVLERLCGSYHGRNWEAMTIARHVIGEENVVFLGGGRVWV
jgi:nicotinamidase-related amidase